MIKNTVYFIKLYTKKKQKKTLDLAGMEPGLQDCLSIETPCKVAPLVNECATNASNQEKKM